MSQAPAPSSATPPDIEQRSERHDEAVQMDTIINWFRAASPYINAHRGKTLVLALPGEWLRSELLPTLTHDLTLLNHLGVRLVVCFGLRAQVDEQLAQEHVPSAIVAGRRVTDAPALRAIIEAAGVTRNALESRLSMGLPNTPMAGAHLSVSSGNYVTAQPFGVHDGIDFQHTGSVREVHAAAITALLDAGHVVLLPPLAYSVTGDVFNVAVSELASAVAQSLSAEKLVFLVDKLPLDDTGQVLRQASAQHLAHWHDARLADNQPDMPANDSNLDSLVPHALQACRNGVERVHLLKNNDRNALLCELFTRDGSGTMITATSWEHIRPASIQDVGGIIELIEPLQANGTLINRSREQLELDIERFVISERDGMVVACAAMHPDKASRSVEIACIVTHPDYRGEGRADQIITYIESRARQEGYQLARVLSTRTGHWFLERGYIEVAPDTLPPTRHAGYDQQRNSKIYQKTLQER